MPNNKHYSQFVSDTEEEFAGARKLKKPHGMVSLAIPNNVHWKERKREKERGREIERERTN